MTEINLTVEDDTGMQQIEFRKGSRVVISTSRPSGWDSRLYVNGGETTTSITAKHKSGVGVRAWAERALGI